MKTFTPIFILISACLYLGVIFLLSTLPQGERSTDSLKNIHGVNFYNDSGTIQVTESLAHTSLDLREPSLAKELHLTVTFNPGEVEDLYVGVRKTPFWLSYDWQHFYDATEDTGSSETITKTLVIPISDVLQHPDRSIDLMFKGETDSDENIWWELHSIKTEVKWVLPTRWELREYINRVTSKERPL